MTLCTLNYRCGRLGNYGYVILWHIVRFDPSLSTIKMRCVNSLGDWFTEAQLRTLVKNYQVEQKYGATMPYRKKKGSRTPKRRQSKDLWEIEEVRYRVQRQRHIRQGVERRRKPIPYISVDDAIERYERRHERLESCEEMFAIGQGQRFRKKTDIRANVIRGGHGGKICRRPTIDEGKGKIISRTKRTISGRVIVLN